MKFTLLMLGIPLLWIVAVVVRYGAAGFDEGAAVFAAPAVLWLYGDLYLVPLYWAVRVIRYAWFHGTSRSEP